MRRLSKDKVRSLLAQPNGALKLNEKPEDALQAAWELFAEEGNAAACGFLCAAVKRKAIREYIALRLQDDRRVLHEALRSESSKMRKNAARLCGALANPLDEAALVAALQREDTRYVRPSMLLALGSMDGVEARKLLLSYVVEPGDPKHMSAEKEALKMARARAIHVEKHVFCAPKKSIEMELRCARGLSDALAEELREAGFTPRRAFSEGVQVKNADVEGVMNRVRGFHELLFPLGKCERSLAAVAEAAAPFAPLLASLHKGAPPFSFRVEVRGQIEDRSAFAKKIAHALGSKDLLNNPSDYEAELRVELGTRGAKLYAKLFTLPDTRFAYRREMLSASIHPAAAAAVVRAVRPYLHENARVLDICCGSGTLLIERERFAALPCASLTGVDIAHAAIDAARTNAAAAESRAKFVVNDCLRFAAERPYDEILSNLPFGNRVGSHAQNETLYAGIFERLPQWLRPGGTAVLYTMEHTLMKKLLASHTNLRLLFQTKAGAGGLHPGIFVIERL